MAGREVIKTPKEFAECANRLVKGVNCCYQPIEEMMEEPDFIKEAPYSTSMQILKHNELWRGMDFIVFVFSPSPLMNRLFLTSGTKVKMERSLVVILILILVESSQIESKCAKCLAGEDGSDWIKCPRCGQWYHEGCFYAWNKHLDGTFTMKSYGFFDLYSYKKILCRTDMYFLLSVAFSQI